MGRRRVLPGNQGLLWPTVPGASCWPTSTAQAVQSKGFTMIELLVAISVAGILLAIAIPSFRTTVLNNRRAAAVNEFVGSLTYARSLALSRHIPVTMCHSTNPTAVSPVCNSTGSWTDGWVAFADNNSAGTTGSIDPNEEILRQHEGLNGLTLIGETGPASLITFNSSGITTQTGRLALCDSRGWTEEARVIVVGAGGQIRTLPKSQAPTTLPLLTSCTPS